jgi:hypothetical protein
MIIIKITFATQFIELLFDMLYIRLLFAGHEVLLLRLPGVLHPGEHGADVARPRAALPLGPLRPIAASQSVSVANAGKDFSATATKRFGRW